ncbi:MAG: M20/M25/M40 family metallo-hydrolase [Pseudobdellovibrionaceae bacterium]
MKNTKSKFLFSARILFCFTTVLFTLPLGADSGKQRIAADVTLLKSLGIKPYTMDSAGQVGLAYVSDYQLQVIPHQAHQFRKCGGFTFVEDQTSFLKNLNHPQLSQMIGITKVEHRADVQKIVDQVDEARLREWVQWLSSFPHRMYNRPEPNRHVEQLYLKLINLSANMAVPFEVEYVEHKRISQKSLKVTIKGTKYPDEIVVLGGHLDSTNWSGNAPGADDNASGSSNLLETLHLLSENGFRPDRTIEFFWYAGEEGGLLGSSEIAKSYKQANKNVKAVLQLDMTLFPGEGEGVIGNISDYTDPQLRKILEEINHTYVGAKFVDDRCGYACSDHASWFNQGYPAVVPFEATTNTMNPDIHTSKDVLTPKMNFKHSALFSKLAIAFAMTLGKD